MEFLIKKIMFVSVYKIAKKKQLNRLCHDRLLTRNIDAFSQHPVKDFIVEKQFSMVNSSMVYSVIFVILHLLYQD